MIVDASIGIETFCEAEAPGNFPELGRAFPLIVQGGKLGLLFWL
jgi:hypothetical protein